MVTGVCKHCGCTDNAACVDGCCWIDPSQTLCSACLHLASDEELLAGTGFDQERSKGWVTPMELTSPELTALVGLVQLAVRHPEIPPLVRQFAANLVAAVQTRFLQAQLPSLAELVRRGDLPQHDQPLAEPASPIILP